MTAKNPIPGEMSGADSAGDLSDPCVRQVKKARKLRWGHKDESMPDQEDLMPEERAVADGEK